jgi:hypothetical protein
MHGPMNVKFTNNTSKCQIEYNSEFKGLIDKIATDGEPERSPLEDTDKRPTTDFS